MATGRKRDMFWRLRVLNRRDLLVIGIVLVLAVGGLVLMTLPYHGNSNFGFGPEWSCSRAGQGEPVCVKTGPGNPG